METISFLEESAGSFSNRWLTCITTSSYKEREKIRLALEAENIESRPLWKPLHLQPIFKDCKSYLNGTSEKLFEIGLCLPSGSDLSTNNLELITTLIKKNSL
jgi:dTDP-4-amino-4,6-dideoxygalactose transaminase